MHLHIITTHKQALHHQATYCKISRCLSITVLALIRLIIFVFHSAHLRVLYIKTSLIGNPLLLSTIYLNFIRILYALFWFYLALKIPVSGSHSSSIFSCGVLQYKFKFTCLPFAVSALRQHPRNLESSLSVSFNFCLKLLRLIFSPYHCLSGKFLAAPLRGGMSAGIFTFGCMIFLLSVKPDLLTSR